MSVSWLCQIQEVALGTKIGPREGEMVGAVVQPGLSGCLAPCTPYRSSRTDPASCRCTGRQQLTAHTEFQVPGTGLSWPMEWEGCREERFGVQNALFPVRLSWFLLSRVGVASLRCPVTQHCHVGCAKCPSPADWKLEGQWGGQSGPGAAAGRPGELGLGAAVPSCPPGAPGLPFPPDRQPSGLWTCLPARSCSLSPNTSLHPVCFSG